ncbi:MAG: hypothetical protein ACPGNV_15590 [Mangrovicoccus sp.]
MQPKIITCSYCGTRDALVLTGQSFHELACRTCGAPLHDIKALPLHDSVKRRKKATAPRPRGSEPIAPPKSYRKKKRKKTKRLKKKLFKAALDLLDDIFD